MAPKQPLTGDQILEVLRLFNRNMPIAEIAPKFDRSVETIRKILNGEAYRGVTGRTHTPGAQCACPACWRVRIEEHNLDIADGVEAEFRCVASGCGAPVERRAVMVVRSHGQARCDKHDRRRK